MFEYWVIYTVNNCVRLGVILFILLAGLIADIKDPLYESIERNLKKYRQSNDTEQVFNELTKILLPKIKQ